MLDELFPSMFTLSVVQAASDDDVKEKKVREEEGKNTGATSTDYRPFVLAGTAAIALATAVGAYHKKKKRRSP